MLKPEESKGNKFFQFPELVQNWFGHHLEIAQGNLQIDQRLN